MVFNSFQFLWLFPLLFVAYYALCGVISLSPRVRHRLGNAFLILASYGLYLQWKPAYALLLLGVTAVTYWGALAVEKTPEARGRRRRLLACLALLALLPLLVFKYYGFLSGALCGLLSSLGIATSLPGLNWALPLGISFYTLIALGYLFDVYYGRILAERNWWDYALFVSFFPHILSGPISRASDLLPQIKAERRFCYTQAVSGLKALLWGMFLKVVMADRLGLYVDVVLDEWQWNTGTSCLVASFAYSLQIYGDFAGYSLMAVGVGRLMGFELVNNFRRPYFAVSVTDFWRRWHISLSSWLRDYVYIPLGGNRRGKGRTYLNIMLTFLVSGVWHGASWTFVAWGLLHGLAQVIEKALGLQRCESRRWLVRLPRILVTFAVIDVLWVFFRMPTIAAGWGVVSKMLTQGGSVLMASLRDIVFSVVAVGIVLAAELAQEFAPARLDLLAGRHTSLRWSAYVCLLLLIAMTGVLDSGQFIYSSF
ncbi:MAG: MBOAT family protein [Prevotellaceae bacterium]|nr:MBOAT family protein [Prevotellaceae bacterium]